MGKSNRENQTIWIGDNLDIMRGMNSESVDLVYLDPPFNSQKTMRLLLAHKPPEPPSKIRGLSTMWMKPGTAKFQTETLPCTALLMQPDTPMARA